MKYYFVKIALVMLGFLTSMASVASTVTPLMLLQKMQQTTYYSDYQLDFINITRSNIDSLRYRHAMIDNIQLAQLLQLDGNVREILMRDKAISYYIDKNNPPFTLAGDHIIDALPAIVFADFEQLQDYYDYIFVGQARVADQECDIIRVTAKQDNRYSYLVWIDRNSFLPLQIELLDQHNQTLEQFRVITFTISPNLKQAMHYLLNVSFPAYLTSSDAQQTPTKMNWSVRWLPQGFKPVILTRQTVEQVEGIVETQLFSDGLFSIAVNVMPLDRNNQNNFAYQGLKTMYSEARHDHEIVVIGDIPQDTAKMIANSILFNQ